MVTLSQLWLPVLLSAVLVFVVSSLVHMVFKWHQSDYLLLPGEEEFRALVRKANPAPGQYVIPHMREMSEMARPEVKQKFVDGPVGFLVIKAAGLPRMGPPLALWFLFSLVLSVLVAYLTSRTLHAGDHYLRVFRVAGTVAFVGYSAGAVPNAIWMGKPWSSALKEVFDGLLYGLVTAGAFGWLWPR